MIPGSANPLLLKSAAAAGGYQIERSLRFNSSDSGFCSRTPAVAGDRRTWTWAGWVKRSSTTTDDTFFSTTGSDDNTLFSLSMTGLSLYVAGSATAWLATTLKLRDPSAWFHLQLATDTTQATSSDRYKLYMNGIQITSFTTQNYPTLNQQLGVNTTLNHNIGAYFNMSPAFNGYLADIHFIDGQALTPSSFTEVSATTGQLIPKAYTGTFGTNGFWLKFSDNSAATAATLGKDTSGTDLGNAITTPASNAPPTVDYLIVGGGGGAGGDLSGGGGGGGVLASSVSLTSSTSYAVAVGTGGAGNSSNTAGLNGGNSSFNAIIALGGGGGAGDTAVATTGGSGGGASTGGGNSAARTGAAGTSPQGYAGGNGFAYPGGPGGGGGAGQAGSNGGSANGTGGNGGNGVQSSITGTSTYYGGGGGGGGDSRLSGPAGTGGLGGGGNGAFGGNGSNGTANTGGGGGGGSQFGGDGGNGGSGVVIIRYANTYADLSIGSGLTYSFANSGGYKIYTFTASTAANNWSVNNFSVTAGSGNDSLVDTPTSFGTDTGVGGEVRGNYCTWNPLKKGGGIGTPTNGNLDVTNGAAASVGKILGTIGMSSGKWYWEGSRTNAGDGMPGIATDATNLATYVGGDANSWGYYTNGFKYNNGSATSYAASYATNDIIGVAFDADIGTLTFYKNGVSQGTAYSGLTNGPYFPAQGDGGGGSWVHNFGQRAFAYQTPGTNRPAATFKALCDTNLGAPLVAKPSTVFDVITYTGTGSSLTLPNGSSTPTSISFTPDFAWLKGRSGATDHALYDAVRGVQKDLVSNSTSAETTETTGLTAFGTNTFTVGSLAKLNTSSSTYVAWAWDAGTSTVSNTAGSITSQVRANVSAGFSVVGWNYPIGSPVSTIGHGLGVKPAFIIIKTRDNGSNWIIYHTSTGATKCFRFTTGAASTETDPFNNTEPTSSVFTIGSGSWWGGGNMIAYCFAPVVGYSSFGAWVGSGTTNDGAFIYTGFRPRFILLKNTDNVEQWFIYDSARRTYNVQYPDPTELRPNSSAAEGSYSLAVTLDFLSNGFKIRGITNGEISFVGRNYIYAAFAESPFQYARAR